MPSAGGGGRGRGARPPRGGGPIAPTRQRVPSAGPRRTPRLRQRTLRTHGRSAAGTTRVPATSPASRARRLGGRRPRAPPATASPPRAR
eukprot:11449395-Alexandrium_andersonii.AAC.1